MFCCGSFLVGGRDGLGWEVLYWMGLSACNFRQDENIFLSPLWLVAILGFLIISVVSGIVHEVCLIISAVAC
jgi:hypothetical protein